MTGYASSQSPVAAAASHAPSHPRIGLEIRSVNSRFLDLSFRLSDELRAFEPALRELIGQRVRRGKVELRAYLIDPNDTADSVPDAALLQNLARVQDQVLAWLPQAALLSVSDVMRFCTGSHAAPSAVSAESLLALAHQVLDDFVASRAREGLRLSVMLGDRTTQLRQLANAAHPLVPQLVEQQRAKFVARFTQALQAAESAGPVGVVSVSAAQERALTEAAAFAIRIDVAEELTRLLAHLDEVDALLTEKTGKPDREVGKRLDFLIQELHREANTLGAKSSTLELTRISVDMKVFIEQMREQVQNLE